MRTQSRQSTDRAPAGRLRRAAGFLGRYGYAAAALLHVFTFGLLRAQHRHRIAELARQFGYAGHRPSRRAAVPIVELDELVTHDLPIQLRALDEVDGNVSLRELVVISKLVRQFEPQRIFEIGTFDGRTTLNMAANATGARVFTLDLPRAAMRETCWTPERGEEAYIAKDASGTRFRGTDCEGRITQLYGDSAVLDVSSYTNMDIVFVDGSHAYENVLGDSRTALRMVAGRGIVIWHDYGVWDGVTRALDELRESDESFAGLRRVAGTSLVLLRAGGQWWSDEDQAGSSRKIPMPERSRAASDPSVGARRTISTMES